MDDVQLYRSLLDLKAYKKSRVDLGTLCVTQGLLRPLISYCYPHLPCSHQACWTLEQSFLLFEEDCRPYLDQICWLFTLPINTSGMRSLTKIAYVLCRKFYSKKEFPVKTILTKLLREQLLEGCFNQLLEAHGKSANLSFAARSVQLMAREFDWVREQLPGVIEIHLGNPENKGFHTVGKKILNQLQNSKLIEN